MKLRKRKLNRNEKYACSSKSIAGIFKETDAFVSLGFLSRRFDFDFYDSRKAKINGTVVLSASINARDNADEEFYNKAYISLYVISDARYDDDAERVFIEEYLPELHRWYECVLKMPDTAVSGVYNIIIEWNDGEFKKHSYRYT